MFDLTGRKALVTGATGYVAGWVARRRREEGFDVDTCLKTKDCF